MEGIAMPELASIIRKKMKDKRLTAKSLSEISGVTMSTIHNITTGRSKNPTLNILKPLAEALECTVSEIIGENKTNDKNLLPTDLTFTDNKLLKETLIKVVAVLLSNSNDNTLTKIHQIIQNTYKPSLEIDKRRLG